MNKLTYQDLLDSVRELSPEQLKMPVMVAKGRKLFSLHDVALSCECKGPAVEQIGENYPLLIANS